MTSDVIGAENLVKPRRLLEAVVELGEEARRSGGCASGPATACLRLVVTKPPIAALLCVGE